MKLKDYYRNVVDINDSLKGGWAKNYYGIFSKVIEENNYKKAAEIGIGYGTHAKSIIKNTNLEKLYLIDPMRFYENDLFATDVISQEADIPGNNFNELYALIQEELLPWEDKLVFIRKPSLEVSVEDIPDESLDCIFIDGDHKYKAVLADLNFWWKKLRHGGQILGDDWWINDVQKAVIDFSLNIQVPFDLLNKPDETYKIYRFKKV
jgi:SAM-dependent methyltransferase